mgnify:CR=1 FL=1
MSGLTAPIRAFIATAPLAHVVTLDPDGAPQVSMAWVGIEDDELVIGTLPDQPKLQNLRADPRIAVSFEAPGKNAYGLDHYLVLRGRARVTEGGAAALLHDLSQRAAAHEFHSEPEVAVLVIGAVDGDDVGMMKLGQRPGLSQKLFSDARARCDLGPEQFERDEPIEVAELAHSLGLGVNAGHDLDLDNRVMFRTLPHLDEVSIGHALISRAVFVGLQESVRGFLGVLTETS